MGEEFGFNELNILNNEPAGSETQTLKLFLSNDGSGAHGSIDLKRHLPAIGSGAEGVTYKGKLQDLPVTIKILSISNATQTARANHEFSLAKRFLNNDCNKRPNLLCFYGMVIKTPTATNEPLKFYSPDLEPGAVALLYEYAEGTTLTDYIAKYEAISGPVPGFEKIMYGIMKGVSQLENQGLVHRDLKSNNIIINDKNGDIKIIDYGTACLASECPDSPDGTIVYQAPNRLEPALRQSVGLPRILFSSDLYAAGLIYYELFAKRRLFETDGQILAYTSSPTAVLPLDGALFGAKYINYKHLITGLLAKTIATRYTLKKALGYLQYEIIKNSLEKIRSRNAIRTMVEVLNLFDTKFVASVDFDEAENRLVDFTVNTLLESYIGPWKGGRRKRTRRRRALRRKTRRTN